MQVQQQQLRIRVKVRLLLQFGHAGRLAEFGVGVDLPQNLLQCIAEQWVISGNQDGECLGAQGSSPCCLQRHCKWKVGAVYR